MVNFKENYHFSRFQRGSNIFQGGGGVHLLIPYRNPYYLWFSRGGGSGPPAPPPPLDPHLGVHDSQQSRYVMWVQYQQLHTYNEKLDFWFACQYYFHMSWLK